MSNRQKTMTMRVFLQYFFLVVVVPLLPLLISGRWGWWEAWVVAIVLILGFAVARILAERRTPGFMAERTRLIEHEDAKPWDKVLVPLMGLGMFLILPVAGFEARYDWRPLFGLPVKIITLFIFLAGYVFGSYALISNPFFSVVVRPQTERGQQVITGGPYCWVRHPGYAGTIWTNPAIPILLDSAWAFLPLIFLVVVLVIRTNLEDKTLQNELAGYREYAGRVRYRLFPGIW